MIEHMPFFSEDQETFYGEIDGVRWTHEGELGDALSLSITTSAKLISEQLHFALCNIEDEFIFVGNIKPAFEAFNMNELRYLHIVPAQKTLFGDGEKLEIRKTLAQLSPKLTVKYKKIEGAMFQRSALELNVLILDPTREQLLNYGRIGTSVILTISPEPILMSESETLPVRDKSEVKGRISRIAGENKEAAESVDAMIDEYGFSVEECDTAIAYVKANEICSIPLFQRVFHLGYNKAQRIVDYLLNDERIIDPVMDPKTAKHTGEYRLNDYGRNRTYTVLNVSTDLCKETPAGYDNDGSVTISSDYGSVTMTGEEFRDTAKAAKKARDVVTPVIENALGKGKKPVLKPKNGGTEARA